MGTSAVPQHNMAWRIQDGGEVSQAIVELTDQTFERIQPQLGRYIADPRRRVGEDGDTVKLDVQDGRLWDEGKYGRVALRVADKESRRAVGELLEDDITFADTLRFPNAGHGYFLENCVNWADPSRGARYQPIGTLLLLKALRDRHPRGNAHDHRPGLMVPMHDYSTYPPEDWGERHGVGVELITRYRDAQHEDHPTSWRLQFATKTRFDMPDEPLLEVKSSFKGLIDSRDIAHTTPFSPNMTTNERASKSNVELLRGLFETAKDLRPVVTPIAEQLRQDAAIAAMYDRFMSGSGKAKG